jgi:hypothetical protein
MKKRPSPSLNNLSFPLGSKKLLAIKDIYKSPPQKEIERNFFSLNIRIEQLKLYIYPYTESPPPPTC